MNATERLWLDEILHGNIIGLQDALDAVEKWADARLEMQREEDRWLDDGGPEPHGEPV